MAIVKCYIFTYYTLQQYKFDRSFSDVSHISNTSYTFLQHDTNSILIAILSPLLPLNFFRNHNVKWHVTHIRKKGKRKGRNEEKNGWRKCTTNPSIVYWKAEEKIRLAGYGEIILGDKRKNGEGGGEGKGDGADRRKIERKGKHEKLGYGSECRWSQPPTLWRHGDLLLRHLEEEICREGKQ